MRGSAWTTWSGPPRRLRCNVNSRPAVRRRSGPVPVSGDTGDAVNDLVAMEWYVARDGKQAAKARAIVVVHESGRAMPVGRLIARGMRLQGLHAFLVQLPGYGVRRKEGGDSIRPTWWPRRARPWPMSGGLATQSRLCRSSTAATSPCRERVSAASWRVWWEASTVATTAFLTLAGGDLYDVLQNGEKDTASAQAVCRSGAERRQAQNVDQHDRTAALAHRLRPQSTWLYSGVYDNVVPLKNAIALAEAARLDKQHHVRMLADHYSGIVFLPSILAQMHQEIVGVSPAK